MYALHPTSLPPKGALGKQRVEYSADDLARLYKLDSWEYIVWDHADNYDWQDFIHLYPMYYDCYDLPHGRPVKDIPCRPVSTFSGRHRGGKASPR